ncbi:MAG: cell surface protein [Blastopirellula sp.]|nr:cell surface protein [Blastopirellula sp.]
MPRFLLTCLTLWFVAAHVQAEEKPLSFANDVMPVLFRAGCNQGTCHGSARGKDGFALSLFGFNKQGDHYRLTQEIIGRRINMAVPEDSLLLLKATGAVPHTGGQRFKPGSSYYNTLKTWIEQGALNDSETAAKPLEISLHPPAIQFVGVNQDQAVTVSARYSDGTVRDVTHLSIFSTNNHDTASVTSDGLVTSQAKGDTYVFARFDRFTVGSEIIVLPTESSYRWSGMEPANYVDELVFQRLQQLQLNPSAVADDSEFVRRVYLDLAGAPPSVEQYHRFLNDARPNKRALLIDALLDHEDFTDLWTGLWAESVRLMGGGYTPVATDLKAAESYYQWIHGQIKQNRPFNAFVYDQVTASGSNLNQGPTNLYTMLVHNVRFQPKSFAADFSQLFLGVQIQCAECHNHPFDRWTMDDYYGFVSFFTGITRKPGAEPREFYIYNNRQAAPMRHLIDGRPMPATVIGGENPVQADRDSRIALAEWLTSPDNQLFARNIANRVWAHFFHRGLVEPVDDMRVSNPPTNGPLLEALSEHFVQSEFDLRQLIRDICNSKVYQLSATPNSTNQTDDRQFSRARLRRLRSDVLLDSIIKSTEWNKKFRDFPLGTKAVEFYPRTPGDTAQPLWRDEFLKLFGRSSRNTICACETKSEATLSQTLHLAVGNTVHQAISSGLIDRLLKAEKTPQDIIKELFIRCLSREPTAEEMAKTEAMIGDEARSKQPYEDILWALINSTEFMTNH